MGRRIRWLGVIMVACLGLVVAQLVNIQLVKAKQLQSSPFNPRVSSQQYINPRGTITAADGTVLAKSVPTPAGTDTKAYPYHYVRQYPQGPLYAGITGYDSALYYGTAGIEQQYDASLSAHQQPPQTLSQLLFRQQQPRTTDNVALSVEPPAPERGVAGLDDAAPGRQQGRGGRGAPAVDGERPGHGVEPHLRPQRADGHVAGGRTAGLLQLHPEGPRGLLPAPAHRHPRDLPTGLHHEGRDQHRGLQPQAGAGRLQLPEAAVPDVLRLEQASVQRRVHSEQLDAVRRDDDPDVARLV